MKSRYNYFDDKYEYVEGPIDKLKRVIDRAKLNKTARQDDASDRKAISQAMGAHNSAATNTAGEGATIGRRVGFVLLLFVAFVMIIATFVALVVSDIDKQNQKLHQFNADAGLVCATYAKEYGACGYENMYTTYGISGYRMTGLCYAREMDFDADGRSELLICYCDNGIYYVEAWGYVDDSFTNLYHQRAAQTNSKDDDVWITIRYGDGKYYIGAHSETDITSVELYALKKGSFSVKDSCIYDIATEAFYVNEQLDTSFERIKLAVLREEKAESVYTTVSDTIDKFTSSNGDSTVTVNTAKSINNAYYEIVNSYNQKYGEAKYIKEGSKAYVDGLALVKLVDFNNDDVPELVLGFRRGLKVRDEDNQGNYISRLEYKYCCEIYTYRNGNAYLVYENEGMSTKINNSDDTYFMYKYQDGTYNLCNNSYTNLNYGQNVSARSTIYGFNGKAFSPIKKAEYTSEYGYYHYYIDDEQVYSSQFNNEGYFLPMFNGNDDYDEDVYTVIYLSRSSVNSKDVQPLVSQTQAAIKSLNPSYAPKNN